MKKEMLLKMYVVNILEFIKCVYVVEWEMSFIFQVCVRLLIAQKRMSHLVSWTFGQCKIAVTVYVRQVLFL